MRFKGSLLLLLVSFSTLYGVEGPNLDSRLDRDKARRRFEAMNDFRLQFSERDILKALVTKDDEKLNAVRQEIDRCDGAVVVLLEKWDAAKTPEEKELIIKEASGGCALPPAKELSK